MKRILLISYCGPPNAAVPTKRISLFARHLDALGWHPTIISAHPRYAEVCDDFFVHILPPGCRIYHTPSFEPFQSRFVHSHSTIPSLEQKVSTHNHTHQRRSDWILLSLRRLLSYAYPVQEPQWGWNHFVLRRARDLIRTGRFSVVLVSLPPFSSMLIGYALKKEFGIKLVLDYRDPFHQVQNGVVAPFMRSRRYSLRARRHILLENRVLSAADGILAATSRSTQQFRDRLGSEFNARTKTITNAYDEDTLRTIPPKRFDRFTIIHGGSLHGPRIEGLKLLEALGRLLRSEAVAPDAFQVLLFPGTLPDFHKERRLRTLLDRFPELKAVTRFMPYLGYYDYISYVKGADLLFLASGPMKEMILAKFYDYLGTGRPILALADPDSAMADIINRTRSGVVIPYNEMPLLKNILRALLNQARPSLRVNPQPASGFTASSTASDLAAFLDRIVGLS